MFPLKTDTPLTQDQVVTVTRLMLHVAHVDGDKTAEELALIRAFYEGCAEAGNGWQTFDSLDGKSGSPDVAASDFADQGQREMALAICLMVAWADGAFSAREDESVRGIADKLGIGGERFAQVLALVKDHMLAQLAGLPDVGSIVAVAKELG